ncbi:MAG: protein kinase, partial [Planctomycetota bacterium]|nr:protein kinase [Planctomycetota bacterium]
VYKALQLSLDRTVALKILSKELCRDTAFIEMFVKEARNAGQLNHPNILHVYDVGKFNDIYYLSMEYMKNGSLGDLFRRSKGIKLRHAIPM